MTKLKKNFGTLRQMLIATCFLYSTLQAQALVEYSSQLMGKEVEIGNLLEWSTASEHNSKLFVVERSVDGVDYEDIGVIEAAGSSENELNYRYLDFEKREDSIFYRIKEVDLDGSANYSQTIMVKKKMPNEYMVIAMTNTTTNRLFTVTLEAWTEGELNYQLVNYKGEQIFETSQFLAYGLNEIQVNLEHENEGIYKLKMAMNGEEEMLVIRKKDKAIVKQNVASKN